MGLNRAGNKECEMENDKEEQNTFYESGRKPRSLFEIRSVVMNHGGSSVGTRGLQKYFISFLRITLRHSMNNMRMSQKNLSFTCGSRNEVDLSKWCPMGRRMRATLTKSEFSKRNLSSQKISCKK
ncbi:hypothetical protein CEXT_804171 [Caerostris extrusa]|uniref:Uncharacterized protein n=1 Tax=Caerostris extrusa TaxID=172846 RepID=A0AAV4N2B9_CAEEX|nr:hypothetical protein CEXT_804171 [Caerostris extrusa]